MLRRRESERERVLLRLLEQKERQIDDLLNRLMWATGQTWTLPPHPENVTPPREPEPRDWTAHPEQEA
jgi:hypothetical protein